MQPRVLARRQVQPALARPVDHHAIRADVQVAGVRIARDHRVGRARIATAVQWPVFGERQAGQINPIAAQRVLVHRRIASRDFFGRDANLHLVLDAPDELQGGRVGRLLERQRGAAHTGAEDVPQQASADGARLEPCRPLEQHRWRRRLPGDEIGHRSHLFDRVHSLVDTHQLAELLDAAQPLTQILDHLTLQPRAKHRRCVAIAARPVPAASG